ncbi:MAG: hypothetical protein R6X10_11615 [Desulfobacterales bacterium]
MRDLDSSRDQYRIDFRRVRPKGESLTGTKKDDATPGIAPFPQASRDAVISKMHAHPRTLF